MRWFGLLLAVAVVFAGCSATDGPTEPVPEITSTSTSTDTPRPTTLAPTPTPTPTTTRPTPTPEPVDNPWGRAPIIVGIDSSADPGRNYSAHVVRAVRYWDAHENVTDWTPEFVVEPDAEDPDIVVRFVSDIDRCGSVDTNDTIGCASLLSAGDHPANPEVVQVNMGLTNESTYRVARHEFGHVLGLTHDEGPGDVMAPYDTVYDAVLRVYIAYDNTATLDRRITREQVRHALDYYTAGADGFVEEDVGFAVIEERGAADVVVEFTDGSDADGSVAGFRGETFVIEIEGIDLRKRGWHVGYWLGFYFGASSIRELPPPFDNPEADDRQRWWV